MIANITFTPRSSRCLTVEPRSVGLRAVIPRSMKTPPSTHPGVEVIRFFRNADWASREYAELDVSTNTLAYPATRMRANSPFFFVSIAVIFMVQYITLILYLVKGYERSSAYISSRCKPAPSDARIVISCLRNGAD